MNKSILYILNVVLAAARAKIPLRVKIALHVAVHAGDERKETNIKLALLVEERPLTILLDDVAALLAVDVIVAYDLLYLLQLTAHCDSAPTVRVFTWLHDPQVATHRRILL